ncbi:hypothetical protein DPMN_014716 [Dreissena polymorpha]|uniref:Uncharacterized protein n=1 Tax=Dreissena polymorpha TaxID=45954 RepID=A0A9D4N9R1_DREPO|nr:hypothetical protein DPMN_014716 [Dreissena polymorpha]
MRPIAKPNGMMGCISYADSVRKDTGRKSQTPMRMKMKQLLPTPSPLISSRWTTRHL